MERHLPILVVITILRVSSAYAERFVVSPFTYRYSNYFGIDLEQDLTTSLRCRPHADARRVGIYRKDNEGIITQVIRNGMLVPIYDDEFSLTQEGDQYILTFKELSEADSSYFRCRWSYNCRSYGLCQCRICDIAYRDVYMQVYYDYSSSESIDQCVLIDDANHIYFTGDRLLLSCSGELSAVYFNNVTVNDLNAQEDTIQETYLYNISLDQSFNGTTITCEGGGDYKETNLCEAIPKLTVHDDLLVAISPPNVTIRDGESVNFTCTSNIYEPSSFHWDIIGDINFNHLSMEEIPGGTELFISDIDFRSSMIPSFTIACNVTFRSRAGVAYADVKKEIITTTSAASFRDDGETAGTTPLPEIDLDSDNHGSSPSVAAIAIPVTFVLITVVLVAFAVVYCSKSEPKLATKNVYSKNDNLKAAAHAQSENAYYTAGIHSDEVYNVVYASHDL